ncbi:class I SAM-dependent methyltransferase [Chroococcidiopsis sp. FACHB-1243]|uniref:class I SAM-dependent methyltransferase n=1 Tax=Chroococcidiopsis sp. [FACHB-1243] TaxID=2692781 RepID=UPI00177B316D|nr:class I SAM-dependent methyltransferase [Chroococcidiopsis sp. [FACHB-1243]]MBD2310031.1 class I SAM-dependent methyltransferase [Chroococcidiopsis sp. [FACHB-1243]]
MATNNRASNIVFDRERAANHDQQFAKLAPMRNGLDLSICMVLSELPDDARILCVGVGTGTELIALAQHFPQWQFTAVEPAAPMLDICRQKAEEYGIASRCTFHEGYLASLPASDAFDAATCIWVSHFITQLEQRHSFFRQIGARLRPNGYLVSSDAAFDMSTPAYKSLLEVSRRMFQYAQMPAGEIEKIIGAYGRDVAILPPQEVAAMIASSGFDTPVLFFQTFLVHAWYAKRSQ